jgi:hypothetical protein
MALLPHSGGCCLPLPSKEITDPSWTDSFRRLWLSLRALYERIPGFLLRCSCC